MKKASREPLTSDPITLHQTLQMLRGLDGDPAGCPQTFVHIMYMCSLKICKLMAQILMEDQTLIAVHGFSSLVHGLLSLVQRPVLMLVSEANETWV